MKDLSKRIAREQKITEILIHHYCHHNHGPVPSPCPSCESLVIESHHFLDHCPYGEDKPQCRYCECTCFSRKSSVKMNRVISYSTPRLFFKHPVLVLEYLCRKSLFIRYVSLGLSALVVILASFLL